jgi:glutathione peroxidase
MAFFVKALHPPRFACRMQAESAEREALMNRRQLLLAGAGAVLARPSAAQTRSGSAHDHVFEGIQGGEIRLAEFRGRPFMVVNTASRCGFTRQYAGLQQLWSRYRERGLVVIGVPANDFAGQEPGSNEDILGFCSSTFGVTFPLAAKTVVIGPQAHPFYRWAAAERPGETPRWNFHKYLIGRDGQIAAVFPASTEPTDPRVFTAIERAFIGRPPTG